MPKLPSQKVADALMRKDRTEMNEVHVKVEDRDRAHHPQHKLESWAISQSFCEDPYKNQGFSDGPRGGDMPAMFRVA